jgi:hypothetical protein
MQHPLLIWIAIAVLEVTRHWYLITKKKVSPNKVFSFIARAAVATLIFVLFEWRPGYESFPAYIIVGWFIHDVFLNLLRGNPVWYLNDHGFLDKLQRNSIGVLGAFVLKCIALIGLGGIYFFNY